MLTSSVQRLTSRFLGLDAVESGLIAAQQFRTAFVTAHRPRSTVWEWTASDDHHPMTAVVFPTEGWLQFSDEGGDGARTGSGVLLHSTHSGSLTWNPASAGTIVWLDTRSVLENGVSEASSPLRLPADPLTVGYRSFAEAVVHGAPSTSSVSAYFVERLLLEMTLGVVLEGAKNVFMPTVDRPIDRARTLMLLHRHDPQWGVEELAHALHMSLRQVQRVFAAEGTTPASALRRLRVQLAESMLKDPTYERLSIPQVAGYSGFANGTTLRRALRRHGRRTPRAIRQEP